MKNLTAITLGLIIISVASAFALIINVPGDYSTIQEGINASTDGDTVLVQPSTYTENINFYGHNIILGSLFLTTEDTFYISTTVIDGDSASPVVFFSGGETTAAVITGFTIQNGANASGGGIYCLYNSNPTISYCTITDNYASQYGGGIACWAANPVIVHNTISNNVAMEGGGISCRSYSQAIINGNIVRENTTIRIGTTGGHGAGMSCVDSDPTIINNTFIYNSTSTLGGCGGGICCITSSPHIANNLFARNTCIYGGGGICCSFAYPTIINNTIYGNNSSTVGGGISCRNGSSPTVTNCILWSNSAPNGHQYYGNGGAAPTFSYCDVYGGISGEGNINIDPLIRSISLDDFHLQDSIDCGDAHHSPCIDAGDLDILDSLMDCAWGLGTSRSDIGAYGGGHPASPVNIKNTNGAPSQFELPQNYPNPFNATTMFRYFLPNPGWVSFTIWNITGRQMITLHEGMQQTGHYTTIWDASEFSSGIYFARYKYANQTSTIKLLLLK